MYCFRHHKNLPVDTTCLPTPVSYPGFLLPSSPPALPLYLFPVLWHTVPDKQRGAMLICPWNEGAVTGFSQTQEELFCINLLTQRRISPLRRRRSFRSGRKRIFSRSPLPGARIARSTCSMTALPLQQACPISATSFPAPSRTSSPATRP